MGVLLVACSVALDRGALAAPGGSAERAKSVLAELEADPTGGDLVAPAVTHARESLARAERAETPAQAAILADTALEWAEVAHDLKRASQAEQASDRLEQEASALQTELARMRAAVERAMARAGQARQSVQELEKAASRGGPPPAVSVPAPAPVAPPAPSPAAAPSVAPKAAPTQPPEPQR